MSNLMDDDNIEEFRGGTLQLTTPTTSSREHRNVLQEGTASFSNSTHGASAILTGVDVVSPITSSSSSSEKNETVNNELVPLIQFSFESATNYFSHRNGLVQAAIDECNATLIFPNQDGQVIGSWLLTEISLWDNEKERLVTLTDKALISIKYDFIALRQLEFRKVYLEDLDTVVIGDLIYPPSSLVPRLNGLADGVSAVVREGILAHGGTSQMDKETPKAKLGPIDLSKFESRNRNMKGVRAMWNRGRPLSFLKKWNPFDNDIPMYTFTSHPLYFHKDSEMETRSLYDVDSFARQLVVAAESARSSEAPPCIVQHASILLPTYLGLTSVIHNKNSLGFFKVRGKFSF